MSMNIFEGKVRRQLDRASDEQRQASQKRVCDYLISSFRAMMPGIQHFNPEGSLVYAETPRRLLRRARIATVWPAFYVPTTGKSAELPDGRQYAALFAGGSFSLGRVTHNIYLDGIATYRLDKTPEPLNPGFVQKICNDAGIGLELLETSLHAQFDPKIQAGKISPVINNPLDLLPVQAPHPIEHPWSAAA